MSAIVWVDWAPPLRRDISRRGMTGRKLVGAKLGPRLTIATDNAKLNTLLLRSGVNRDDDDFVEIMIYADKGIDTQDVARVLIQVPPSTPEEHHRQAILRDSCRARGVKYVES